MKAAVQMQLADGNTAVVRSDVMRQLMVMVERVARHDAAVLIVGETGAGKEMIAKAVHLHSLRCGKAFIDVNCAALPEHLVESELFGYEKGAFSGADNTKPGLFELADQGTLMLDEIGELDGKIQAKLLRVLDGVPYYRLGGSRKVNVNVRVIAATNRDLEEEVRAGKFRRDLFHRLTQFQLLVPPLRERQEDIIAIAEHFLHQHLPAASFSQDAVQALLHYHWPGNVRELKNVIFKSSIQAKAGTREVRACDLPAEICGVQPNSAAGTFSGNLDDMERQMILQALSQNEGNQTKAALQLGISGRTLRRKLDKYKRQAAESPTALGTLSAHQQRYFRASVEIPVLLELEGGQVEALSVNISAGGMAVHSPTPIAHGATMQVSFTLPGSTSPIEAKSQLAWTGPDGLSGLGFVDMHPAVQRELHQWLLEKARSEGWVGDQSRG